MSPSTIIIIIIKIIRTIVIINVCYIAPIRLRLISGYFRMCNQLLGMILNTIFPRKSLVAPRSVNAYINVTVSYIIQHLGYPIVMRP